jgi:hypothetical protein
VVVVVLMPIVPVFLPTSLEELADKMVVCLLAEINPLQAELRQKGVRLAATHKTERWALVVTRILPPEVLEVAGDTTAEEAVAVVVAEARVLWLLVLQESRTHQEPGRAMGRFLWITIGRPP